MLNLKEAEEIRSRLKIELCALCGFSFDIGQLTVSPPNTRHYIDFTTLFTFMYLMENDPDIVAILQFLAIKMGFCFRQNEILYTQYLVFYSKNWWIFEKNENVSPIRLHFGHNETQNELRCNTFWTRFPLVPSLNVYKSWAH